VTWETGKRLTITIPHDPHPNDNEIGNRSENESDLENGPDDEPDIVNSSDTSDHYGN